MTQQNGYTTGNEHGRKDGVCVQCGVKMGAFLGTMTEEGPVHNECVANYRRAKIKRCAHCDQPLEDKRVLFKEKKFHPQCIDDHKAGRTWEPPAMTGVMQKFAVGRSKFFGAKNWKERFFVINSKTGGLVYYENEEAYRSGKPPKNMAGFSKNTRMVTKPSKFTHKNASNPSKELIIIFQEGGKEMQLLLKWDEWTTKDQWQKCLANYIKDIDNPQDTKEKY